MCLLQSRLPRAIGYGAIGNVGEFLPINRIGGMIEAMKYAKVSVTLEPEVAAELREVAGSRGISAFVNDAVRQQLQARRLRRMLDEMECEYGPIPDNVRDEVDALEWPA